MNIMGTYKLILFQILKLRKFTAAQKNNHNCSYYEYVNPSGHLIQIENGENHKRPELI